MHLKIIGAGIVGICTAVRCLEAGHSVDLVYATPPSQTTSAQAGAIWLPYLAEPLEQVLPWAEGSHQRYLDEIAAKVPGVQLVSLEVETPKSVHPIWMSLLPAQKIQRLPSTATKSRWQVEVPLITPLPYLAYWWEWLSQRVKMEQRIVEDLQAECTTDIEWVINCTGLGAKKLCHDPDIYPVRGQLLKLGVNPSPFQYVEESKAPLMTYVFSRAEDTLIGGTAEAHVWENKTDDITLKTLYELALKQFPSLKSLPITGSQSGLRPVRKVVRVEREARAPIIHHYGHGGSGYTLAWGSAQRVLELL